MTFTERYPGVLEAVAADYGFAAKDLLKGKKLQTIAKAEARAVAAWIAYSRFKTSYPEIAKTLKMKYPACRSRILFVVGRQKTSDEFRTRCERIVQQLFPSVERNQ